MPRQSTPGRNPLPVLHVVFALTGVLHSIGGALLPGLAESFHLTDSRSGALFFCYYLGTSLGALFCAGRLARLMALSFLADAILCAAIAAGSSSLLLALFLALGIGVGLPMTAVSMYAGRVYADRAAAPLTLLNFTWSAGALLAPLLASRVLVTHSWREVYGALVLVSVVVAAVCWFFLKEAQPQSGLSESAPATAGTTARYAVAALFAFLTFLEVGIENIAATWLASYAMRVSGAGAAHAAAVSSLYWCGFLVSRGLSSLVLLRIAPMRLFFASVVAALLAAVLLVSAGGAPFVMPIAMTILGITLAPIFPLLVARFFVLTPHASDSRWVLSLCGFGGSVLPWLTGLISSRTESLRLGLWVVPAALFLMIAMSPLMLNKRAAEQ